VECNGLRSRLVLPIGTSANVTITLGSGRLSLHNFLRQCFRACPRIVACALALLLAFPARGYDSALSPGAIRDAYFLGSRLGGVSSDLLKNYTWSIVELHERTCISKARIETPFLQVAEYSGSALNYSSQDAVKDFYERPMVLRIFLDICYMRQAPQPNSVNIRFIQKKKEIFPSADTREFYAEPINEYSNLPSNGERATIEFNPAKLDSSTLTVQINTPNGQRVETEFDLSSIR
jgi:hypothetical protein